MTGPFPFSDSSHRSGLSLSLSHGVSHSLRQSASGVSLLLLSLSIPPHPTTTSRLEEGGRWWSVLSHRLTHPTQTRRGSSNPHVERRARVFFLFSSLTFHVRPAKRRRRCPKGDPVYFLFFFCRGRKEEEHKKKSWKPPSFLMIFQKGTLWRPPDFAEFPCQSWRQCGWGRKRRGEEDGIRTKRLPW